MMSKLKKNQWALITGGARRLGGEIAKALHTAGFNIFLHYHQSEKEAKALHQKFESKRQGSCRLLQANFTDFASLNSFIKKIKRLKNIKILINNASIFKPTHIGKSKFDDWDMIFNSNAKAAFFISDALMQTLSEQNGIIINMADIHGQRPYKNYSIYSSAKAALIMMTKALAQELAPKIRVNAIALSTVLWPEGQNKLNPRQKKLLQQKFLTNNIGTPQNIIDTIFYLLNNNFVTASVVTVDGGRTLS